MYSIDLQTMRHTQTCVSSRVMYFVICLNCLSDNNIEMRKHVKRYFCILDCLANRFRGTLYLFPNVKHYR